VYGVLILKEYRGLSSLKPQLDAAGFRLYAAVQELLGVDDFRPYLDGVIFGLINLKSVSAR